MPIRMEEGMTLIPGKYEGTIRNPRIRPVETKKVNPDTGRSETVYYLDIDFITKDDSGKEQSLRHSLPFGKLSPQARLGKLLKNLQMLPEIGETFDEEALDGIKVSFQAAQDGDFLKVVEASIRPL